MAKSPGLRTVQIPPQWRLSSVCRAHVSDSMPKSASQELRAKVTGMRFRPKVAIFSLNFPPEPTGIAPYTGGLAAGLHNNGFCVTAHVAHPHYPSWSIAEGYGRWMQAEDLRGVHVQRRLHYVPSVPRGVRRLFSELTFGLRLMFAAWGNPRVVIAVSPSLFSTALAALRLKLTPHRPALIVWVQDIYTLGLSETGEGGGITGRIVRYVEARTLRAADRVVVIHERFAEYLHEELGVRANKISVVRNWSHLPSRTAAVTSEARATLGWPAQATLAVHTGNMGAKQGLENIVEAARIVDEGRLSVHFVLVGDGSERERLVKLSEGIASLTFVGPLDEERYGLALAAADILLVNEKPGVAAMAVPSKMTSYFYAGRPVIAATDLNGISAAEVNKAGAGVVVAAGDPGRLIDAILAMGSDREAMDQYGACGQKYSSAVLGEEAAIRVWVGIVESMCTSRQRFG